MRNTYLYLIIVFSLTLSACDSGEGYDNTAFFSEIENTDLVCTGGVASSTPEDEAISVSVTPSITVNFCEPMDTYSITVNSEGTQCSGFFSGSIQLSKDDFTSCVQMSTVPTVTNSNKTFTFTPASSLNFNQTYKIRVTTRAQTSAGSYLSKTFLQATGFTTSTDQDSDNTAPTISSVTPPDNDNISRSGTISITFSEAMSTSTITTNTSDTSCSGTIQFSKDSFSTCHQMDGTPSVSSDGKTFTVGYKDLTAETTYKLRVTTGVKDNSGNLNAMSSQYETQNGFTTAANSLIGGTIQGSALSLNYNVTTLVGNGTIGAYAAGITFDGNHLYVPGHYDYKIWKVSPSTGAIQVFAGSQRGSVDGTGTSAQFRYPLKITTDGTSLFVVGGNYGDHTIRKIVISTAVVTTFAGLAGTAGSTDGSGTEARFNQPGGITNDGVNLYTISKHGNGIRKIVIDTAVVTTFAQGVKGTGITTDGTNLYVADPYNDVIKKVVIATGVISTFAGSGNSSYQDGTGTNASFYAPSSIVTDGTNLFVRDYRKIRKIVISSAEVTTVAGSGNTAWTDGTGTNASFMGTSQLTSDGTNIYLTDGDGNGSGIRKID